MSAETDVRADDPRMEQNNDPEYRAKGRKALRAAIGGFFVDMYDVYLPVSRWPPPSRTSSLPTPPRPRPRP
jgi:hypothetical protein